MYLNTYNITYYYFCKTGLLNQICTSSWNVITLCYYRSNYTFNIYSLANDIFDCVGATELVNLVTTAGLAETLTNPDAKFTVFAPTNEAIGKLPKSLVEDLLADTELLKKVSKLHN